MPHILRIRLLGIPQILLNDTPLPEDTARKSLALVYILATEKTPQPREVLASLLWGDVSDTRAKNSLRLHLVTLRKLLTPVLQITRNTVALDKTQCWIDLHNLLELLEQPAQPGETFSREVTDLYRGDFLTGFSVQHSPLFSEWRQTQQEYLRLQILTGWQRLTTQFYQQGGYTEASLINQKLLTIDPLNETAHQQQMRIYLATDQRALAVQQFRTCAQILQSELGLKPSAETIALLQQASKDIKKSQNDKAPGLPLSTSPSLSPIRFWPVLPLTTVLGRDKQVERIVHKLTQEKERLITLVGMAGTGKTVLAQALGQQLTESFANGACFASLANSESKEDAQAAEFQVALLLKAALRIEDNQGEALTILQTFLRDKELLLVLDNCEHLLNAMGIIPKLLSAAPHLHILATSYTPLHLSMESVEIVNGLALPPRNPLSLEEVTASPAATLFIGRTQRIDPGFQLTEANAADIAEICHLVGGLPLALEMAAAWTPLYKPSEMTTIIRQQPGFLTSPFADHPERQRSLSALFAYMWRLLSPEDQRVLSVMAVFADGANREATKEVIQASPLTLNALLQRGLLSIDQNSRLLYHPLMHAFAREQLNSDLPRLAAAQEGHAVFHANLLATTFASPGRIPFPAKALDIIELELNNILLAWRWASNNNRFDLLLNRLEKLYEFFSRRGRVEEAEILLNETIELLKANPGTTPDYLPLLGHLYKQLGQLNNKRGHWQLSRQNLEQGLAIMKAAGEEKSSQFAQGQTFLAYSLAWQGDTLAAFSIINDAITALTHSSDPIYLVDAILAKSTIHHLDGDILLAEETCYQALHIAQKARDALGEAKSLANLGYIEVQQDKFDAALAAWQQCLPIFREQVFSQAVSQTLNNIGYIHVLRSEFDAALPLLQEALALAKQIGIPGIEAEVLDSLGSAVYGKKDFVAARHYYIAALDLVRQVGDERKSVDYLLSVARAYIGDNQWLKAFPILHVLDGYPLNPPSRAQQIAELLQGAHAELPADALSRLVVQSAQFDVMSLASAVVAE